LPEGERSTPLPRSSYAVRCTQPEDAFGCIDRSPRAAPRTSSYRAAALLCSWTAASGIAVRNTVARHLGPAPTPTFGKPRCAATPSEMCAHLRLRKRKASPSSGSGSARSHGIRTNSRARSSAGLRAQENRPSRRGHCRLDFASCSRTNGIRSSDRTVAARHSDKSLCARVAERRKMPTVGDPMA